MEDVTRRQDKNVVEEHGNQITPIGEDGSISQSHQGVDNPHFVIEKLLEMNKVLLEHYADKGRDPSKLPPMLSLPTPGTSVHNPATTTLTSASPLAQAIPVKFPSQTLVPVHSPPKPHGPEIIIREEVAIHQEKARPVLM